MATIHCCKKTNGPVSVKSDTSHWHRSKAKVLLTRLGRLSSLTQEEVRHNCLFFPPLLSQKPFESLTHPVQGRPSPPPPLFPSQKAFTTSLRLICNEELLGFISPPLPRCGKFVSLAQKERRKKANALTWEKSWNDKKKGCCFCRD